MEGDRGGGVCCLLEVPEGCSCQVNILQCTLEGIQVIGDKCIIGGTLFYGAIVRERKKLYL